MGRTAHGSASLHLRDGTIYDWHNPHRNGTPCVCGYWSKYKMKFLSAVVLASCLLATANALAQQRNDDGSIPIFFHVTSVNKDHPHDDCISGSCDAVRYTVAGYARVENDSHFTQFVVECTEFTVFEPTPHITIACPHLRANANVNAKLWAEYIQFPAWQDAALTEIVFQKEVAIPRR